MKIRYIRRYKQGVGIKESGARRKGAPLARSFKIARAKLLLYYSDFRFPTPDFLAEISKLTPYTTIADSNFEIPIQLTYTRFNIKKQREFMPFRNIYHFHEGVNHDYSNTNTNKNPSSA